MKNMSDPNFTTDRLGLEVLTTDECWELVDAAAIGRVAFVDAGEPMVLPITHSVDGHTVVFRSGRGTKLDAIESGRPLAFEVDAWDVTDRTGWSVLIHGTGAAILDDEEIARLDERAAEPWLYEARVGTWLRLTPNEVTGRRLR